MTTDVALEAVRLLRLVIKFVAAHKVWLGLGALIVALPPSSIRRFGTW